MLDIGGANSLPPTIVVGRTLSAYDVPDVQNNQETLTFTVYNQAADPITGVLLTDTLASGVTFASASQSPDQDGQQLAWSLGTIQPYDRASVTLTVSLANPTPTTLDTGASAYGTLDAGMVSWTTAPATLRSTAIAADLLASTPDANTTDPYIQEEAAQLNYDPTQIYNFLNTQIGYNAYMGSVRGARGTLWSDAGNSLDDASLGVALMRASGIPAQYEQGTLSQTQAQQLILSMFPDSYQTLGYVPAGTPTSDPADDPALLSETEQHYWFQFDSGSGMQDADPEFAGQSIGHSDTTSTGNFTEVPQSLRQTTEVSLTAEIYNQAAAALTGGDGLTDIVVLDHTFNDVDLVGHPLTIGNFVTQSGVGGTSISSVTNTYSPYLDIGDDANPDPTNDTVIRGTDYQEVLTNFPLGNQVLTGLFLNMTASGPLGATQTYERSLVDRIGYAARQGLVSPNVTVDPTSPPIISTYDLSTIDVLSGLVDPSAVKMLDQQTALDKTSLLGSQSQQVVSQAPATYALTQFLTDLTRQQTAIFLADSDFDTNELAAASDVKAYFDDPRIVISTAQVNVPQGGSPASLHVSIDLRADSIHVVPFPSDNPTASLSFNVARGVQDSFLETNLLAIQSSAGTNPVSTAQVFAAAVQQHVNTVVLSASNLSVIDSMDIPAEAKARITSAVQQGLSVVVPDQSVMLNGAPSIAWYQINPQTGETIGVTQDGGHESTEYAFILGTIRFTVGVLIGIAAASLGAAAGLGLLGNSNPQAAKAVGAGIGGGLTAGAALFLLFPAIGAGVLAGALLFDAVVFTLEPPLDGSVFTPVGPPEANRGTSDERVSASTAAGNVSGTSQAAYLQVSGGLSASWSGDAVTSFEAQSLTSADATVESSSGASIGSGTLALSEIAETLAVVEGNGSYAIDGQGSLSFYGSAATSLGVSGDWANYSATVNGNLSITLTVPAGVLTLNGTSLPSGTYRIAANSVALGGSGLTTSPEFAGRASITASGSAVELGPGMGNVSVGSTSLNTTKETTLTGYNGTVDVSANGNGTDAVTLSGNAANLLSLSPSPAMLTTDQNTPVTFNAGVNTSFADEYDLTANAPSSWTVSIDDTGSVTVTPAAGSPVGTYPIQIIAQSTTNPDLVSQATVEVTVTQAAAGMTFGVNADPQFTVPFAGTQIPSSFRATLHNTGPSADTYNLTFSNVPAGWTIADSGTSDTVPAGQTGILGIYLVPTGATLPAPGTQVSFTVTATSTSDASITQTVNVTFTMPAIAAAKVTSNPAAVSTTPGTATTATITITNVGNVPYDAALATTTDTGLTISGLSAPGTIPVGQSVTETATLTPDASTPLDSTLNATVNVDQAAGKNGVQVVAVNATSIGGVQLPHPGPLPEGEGEAAAGQTVDVKADVQSEVNAQGQGTALFAVKNSAGQTVFTSTAVPVTLSTIGALNTIDFGTFSTAGFAPGQYTVNVTVDDGSGNPIAGATGTTTLTVSLPVSASVSVDTDNQTPGAVTSTETLNVTSNAAIGNVVTDSTATSVAVDGTLAYVAGTQDLSVVDISNPSSPKVLSTFGSKDLNLGGNTAFNLLGIANNELIVASQAEGASTIEVLIYSLTNPQSPTLLGSVSVPYDYLNGMTIEGTTAYLSTFGQAYDANGDVVSQAGELVAVDFGNPATPVVGGALYHDQPQPNGHASFVNESAVVNPQTLLVTGSTSTGANTQTGTGQVTVVNTGAGGALSAGATLAIPGTIDALGIAVDGTHALVVGSTGGSVSPFSDPSQVGISGNVTLTLLDITNPDNPTVIGTTVVTQNTFQPVGVYPLGSIDVISLGNGQFAINGTLSNGSPTILCVDASNPSKLAVSSLATNASASGLTLAGGQLFGAAADGLTIYQAAALTTTPATVTVTVPTDGVSIAPNSFSLAPASVTNGANSETLTWNLNLAPGANQQITWQTNIANLQIEQVQPVVTGGTLQFTSPGESATTITLAAANVAGVPSPISVTIPVEVAAPGVPAVASAAIAAQNLNITGLSTQLNDLALALTNLVETPTSNVYLGQATAALGSIITLLTNDPFLGSYAASLTAAQTALSAATTATEIQTAITNLGTALDSLGQAITDYALHGFTLSLASSQALALPGAPTVYNVELRNTGSQTTTYDFSVSGLPPGVTAQFSPTSIALAPGQSIPQGATVVMLTLSQSGSALVGGNFTVTATAEGAPEINLSTPGQLTLLAESIGVPVVTVTPPFTQPGGPVDVTAKIQSVVNEPRTLSATFTVADPNGKVIYTDPNPLTVPLTDTSGLTTVDLGKIDTTGFVDGVDTVTVTVTDQATRPLPAATGTANLTIGLPVMASVTTSPTSVPQGTATVTNTLSVSAETPFTDPLTLDGQVATTPSATDVAIYASGGKTYAYVSGSNGVDVVDVTDPANPSDLSTFGTGKDEINNGNFTKGIVATIGGTDYLIIGTTATLNANQFRLLVYSLASPAAPTQVSNTLFPYQFINDLLIDGTTLLVPTSGVGFFGTGLDNEFGTVLAIDMSNPAAPTFQGELYSDPHQSPVDGGDTQQFGGVITQSGVAYIASSTETAGGGFTFNPGVGRVLVVDDSNPASLSVTKEVDIPGTEQALDIAIQGTQALVISSTGGPVGDQSDYGQYSGNLVLSLMDISNPSDPRLIGNTLVTPETFGTVVSNPSRVSVVSIGNGLYAISGTLNNGTPALLLVDSTDPNNIVVSATTQPVPGFEMAVSGNILYATNTQGLTTYLIGTVDHTSYTASVEVPNDPNTTIVSGSFNIPPTSITTGANFDTLTWVRQLAFGQDQQTFTWQTKVQSLNANEVRPVTLGTSVSFVSQGTPGSLTVPATSVTGIPIAEVLPSSDTVVPGGTLTYDLRLSNPLDETVDYYLQPIIGINYTQGTLPAVVRMQPDSTVDVPFSFNSNPFELPGTYSSEIIVVGSLPPGDEVGSGESAAAPFNVILAGTPVIPTPDAHGVTVNLIPTTAAAGLDELAQYTVQVTNTGSVADTFNLSLSGTSGLFNQYFSQNSITVPPGASNFRDVTLTLQPDVVDTPIDENFTVTATSVNNPPVSGTANGTLTILPQGVFVSLAPVSQSSTAPGAPYQVLVENAGKSTDTFNLSLAGPAASIASLATTQTMTLAPGNSQRVDITTTAANFADAGNLPLTVVATSQNNPTVQGSSTANLTVPSTQSVSASFSPATQNLSAPGATSYLLQVNNTGNTEDSYSATITGTTGPITASLIGLDGKLTQSVPLFILPGLSQGAILLDVSGASPGQGTVTVTIQSLTDSAESTTATATLNVASPGQMQVILNTNSGLSAVEGTTTTIASSLLAASVPGSTTSAADVVFTVTSVPTDGSLLLNGQALAQGGTFTQDDINNGRLAYKATEEGTDSFGLNISASGAVGAGATFLISTSDPAVVLTGGFTITALEGASSAVQTVATFTDPGGFELQANYTAEIEWGDGTSSVGTITLPGAGQTAATVTGQHTYTEEGTYSVTVIVNHESAPAATATDTATVSDPAVVGTGGFTYTATEGNAASAQTVATFTDPGGAEPLADYSATIDWGDGTSSTGTISVDPTSHVFTVTGAHTYAQDGTYSVDVTLGHESAPAVTVVSTAQIAHATVTGSGGIAATAVAVSGYEFKVLTGASVATFTDGDGSLPAGDFSATIDWGDGTSSIGSVSLSGTTYTVSGSHTYDDEGHYTVQVSIDQSAGTPSGGATSATVSAKATIHEQLLENGTVGTPDQNWVQEAYRDLFDRQAELSGLNFWVAMLDAGQPRGQVAYDIVQLAFSEEFQRDTVTELYEQYLGRAPDASGQAFWTAYLYDGGTIESMAQALVSSPEYWQTRAGGTDAGFLQGLFQDALGRAIDPTALQYFGGLMAQGQTAADVASIIFNSDEYHRVRVNALFEQFLDRPADADGLAFFGGELDSGYTDELVITQLISSDEYYDDVQV